MENNESENSGEVRLDFEKAALGKPIEHMNKDAVFLMQGRYSSDRVNFKRFSES